MNNNVEERVMTEGAEKPAAQRSRKPAPAGRSLLLTAMQLIICVLFIAGAFAVSLIGGDIHSTVGTWFFNNYNSTIFTGDIRGIVSLPDSIAFWERKEGALEQAEEEMSEAAAELKFDSAPLKTGTITSPFGDRDNNGETRHHNGTDIGADEGSQIFAVMNGTVVTAQTEPSYGKYIVIDHGNGVRTLYAHCSKLEVKEGDKVKAGERIALVGQTGDADGPHLHFELILSGRRTDPQPYLDGKYK